MTNGRLTLSAVKRISVSVRFPVCGHIFVSHSIVDILNLVDTFEPVVWPRLPRQYLIAQW